MQAPLTASVVEKTGCDSPHHVISGTCMPAAGPQNWPAHHAALWRPRGQGHLPRQRAVQIGCLRALRQGASCSSVHNIACRQHTSHCQHLHGTAGAMFGLPVIVLMSNAHASAF